jgi:hypothetical protein
LRDKPVASAAVLRISPLLGALPVVAAICLRSLYEPFQSTVGHLLRIETTNRKQTHWFSAEISVFTRKFPLYTLLLPRARGFRGSAFAHQGAIKTA